MSLARWDMAVLCHDRVLAGTTFLDIEDGDLTQELGDLDTTVEMPATGGDSTAPGTNQQPRLQSPLSVLSEDHNGTDLLHSFSAVLTPSEDPSKVQVEPQLSLPSSTFWVFLITLREVEFPQVKGLGLQPHPEI